MTEPREQFFFQEETSFIEQAEKISSEGKEKKLKKRKGKEAEGNTIV